MICLVADLCLLLLLQIVSLNFDSKGERVTTGSFDHTVKIWDVRLGRCIHTLSGHNGEISSTQVIEKRRASPLCCPSTILQLMLERLRWHIRLLAFLTALLTCMHTCVCVMSHVCLVCWLPQFNFGSDLCISGSIDRTCKVWDVASGQCVHTLRGHNDEILDVSFNTTGSKLVSASADGTSRVFNTNTGACQVRFDNKES